MAVVLGLSFYRSKPQASDWPLPDWVLAELKIVRGKPMVQDNSIGFSGQPSPFSDSAGQLLGHLPTETLVEWLNDRQPHMRTLAAVHLCYLRPAGYRELIQGLQVSEDAIFSQGGCVGGFTTVRDVMKSVVRNPTSYMSDPAFGGFSASFHPRTRRDLPDTRKLVNLSVYYPALTRFWPKRVIAESDLWPMASRYSFWTINNIQLAPDLADEEKTSRIRMNPDLSPFSSDID